MEWVCLLISILPLCCSWCLLAQPHLARLPFRLLISHATSGNCWVQLLPAELLQSFPGISVPGILFPLVLVAPTTISLSWINAKPYLGGEKMQNLSCFKQFCRVLIHAGACGVHVLFCNTSALFEMQKLSLEAYEPSFPFVFYCLFLILGVFFFCHRLYATPCLFPDKAQFHVWIKDYLLSLSHALSPSFPKGAQENPLWPC